ncbi:flagellar brake protein [Burkholderia sp. TSV86]|uniref:flagellar brake protein n=1 Tax=Burkholderia sp. TSV86 TaxID=1385594 RepID=UPI00075E1A42|nr:flagellar brake protein [Burkholderia sp. TSV86]KVE33295.1 flagellar brake protein [Burkholderia sp. TSV86]
MNTEQSTRQGEGAIAPTGHDFGRRNPLEIGVQLRNLVNRRDFLTVEYRGGQLVTRILDVDVGARTFVFDWGALAEQNAGMLAAPCCEFRAAPDGIRVEFSTVPPRETRFEGLPAFEADFPEVLYCVQRREYFRVNAPLVDPFVCRGKLPDGEHFLFEIHNLSLGGLGLRTADERVAALELGTTLHDVELNLNGHGMLSLDLQLVAHRSTRAPSGACRHQLGFRFVSLPGSTENTLQRLITQLEMKRRQLART